jgi:hypothetical protein
MTADNFEELRSALRESLAAALDRARHLLWH